MRARGNNLRQYVGVLTALFLSSVLFFGSAAAVEPTGAINRFKVAATIFPLADMAREVAGERAEIIAILPAGANPHTFELAPRIVKNLEGVKLLLMIGHGFDDWVKAATENLAGVKMITVDEGIDVIQSNGEDPHYWLSIANAKIIAGIMARAFSEMDSSGSKEYQSNLYLYLMKLESTDQKIRDLLSHLPAKKAITVHDGWRYFARDYGLEILGSIEPSPGKEPTPKQLARLEDAISKYQIRVLFSEPTVSRSMAKSLAEDLHLRLYELDPIGTEGAGGYLDLMIANARIIHEALRYE